MRFSEFFFVFVLTLEVFWQHKHSAEAVRSVGGYDGAFNENGVGDVPEVGAGDSRFPVLNDFLNMKKPTAMKRTTFSNNGQRFGFPPMRFAR